MVRHFREMIMFAGAALKTASCSGFLVCRELARFVFEHHRNVIAYRVSEAARAANQFRLVLSIDERALAQGANQNIE